MQLFGFEINDTVRVFISFAFSFLMTHISLPSIYRVAKLKNLYDIPDGRKVHNDVIPRLGGVAIFAGFTISVFILSDLTRIPEMGGIMAAFIIMFFTGIKDDIIVIAPLTKMAGQLLAAIVLVIFGGAEITNLHGFFGIHVISRWIGIPLSIFTILVITNSFNLIDGIDGLAASLAIVAALSFGIWFFLVKDYEYAILSFALIGALLAFLPFNFSSKQKMFMGDTGALIVGVIISAIAIEFNEKNLFLKGSPYFILPAPSVSFGILIVPLFDMLRVMYIRFLTKQKIFGADQNHIHHIFLKLGFSHKQIVLILVLIEIFFILTVFMLSPFVTIRRMLLFILLLAMVIFYIPVYVLRRKMKNKN